MTNKTDRPMYEGIWLDITDQATEGQWVSQASGQISTYTNWFYGEPNGTTNENCASLMTLWSGKWNDLPCNTTWNANTSQYTYCEKVVSSKLSNNF